MVVSCQEMALVTGCIICNKTVDILLSQEWKRFFRFPLRLLSSVLHFLSAISLHVNWSFCTHEHIQTYLPSVRTPGPLTTPTLRLEPRWNPFEFPLDLTVVVPCDTVMPLVSRPFPHALTIIIPPWCAVAICGHKQTLYQMDGQINGVIDSRSRNNNNALLHITSLA